MTLRFPLAVSLLSAAVLSAPDPDRGFADLANGLRYRCVQVPGARGVCAVLALRVGSHHDPAGATGLASAVAHALRRSQAALPPASRFTVRVLGDTTLLSATRPAGQLGELLSLYREVLSGGVALSDDEVTRAVGAAALEADDQLNILPGTGLRWMARRSMLGDGPAGRCGVGVPAELKRLEPATVMRRYQALYRPRHAVLSVLGGLPEPEMVSAVSSGFAELPPGDVDVPSVVAVEASAGAPTSVVSPRVDAPYVSLALRAPDAGDPSYLVFAVAMEVVAARVARAMGDERGRETFGRFPRTMFDYPNGAPLAFVNRRGRDGDGVDRPRAEIEALVASLEKGVSATEVGRARDQVSRRLQLPPYPRSSRSTIVSARALHVPASALAMAEVLGWPADLQARVAGVSVDQVDAALRAALDPAAWGWFDIVPAS